VDGDHVCQGGELEVLGPGASCPVNARTRSGFGLAEGADGAVHFVAVTHESVFGGGRLRGRVGTFAANRVYAAGPATSQLLSWNLNFSYLVDPDRLRFNEMLLNRGCVVSVGSADDAVIGQLYLARTTTPCEPYRGIPRFELSP